MNKKKVVVGMSGGVDSSVAAYILKNQGYEVIGATMNVYDNINQSNIVSNSSDYFAIGDAKKVCERLNIPHYILDLRDIFADKVINYFSNEYLSGKTPNPCTVCNRYIKWEGLLTNAKKMGADYIATGHYAQVYKTSGTNRYTLKTSRSNNKDQTYVLYNLTQNQLKHTIMPLWQYQKSEVRKIADELDLFVANKPDSQEICFIPNGDYGQFLDNHLDCKINQGNFIDTNGNIIGKHKGIAYYTIGQRKGLGTTFGKPMYVKSINAETNDIILVENDDLFSTKLFVENINFMGIENITNTITVKAKIRYNHRASDCIIKMNNNKIECDFFEPQRAITPGQAVVFYLNDYIICGGTICQDD